MEIFISVLVPSETALHNFLVIDCYVEHRKNDDMNLRFVLPILTKQYKNPIGQSQPPRCRCTVCCNCLLLTKMLKNWLMTFDCNNHPTRSCLNDLTVVPAVILAKWPFYLTPDEIFLQPNPGGHLADCHQMLLHVPTLTHIYNIVSDI